MRQRTTEIPLQRELRLDVRMTEITIESPDQLKASYFRNEYQHIFQVIKEIIRGNREWDEDSTEGLRSRRKYRPDVRLHNIVPIIGERGAGKSSIMHTVMGYLMEYSNHSTKNSDDFSLSDELGEDGKLEFFCLPTIDGSLLEPSEDIFKVILALMYDELADEQRRGDARDNENIYVRQKLSRGFEELYRNICQLMRLQHHSEDSYIDDVSPLTSMEQVSSSLKLRKEFEQLLKDFLRWKSTSERDRYYPRHCDLNREQERYLVVSIDDLDLNIEHGYEMLERIHRYLMLPNVIVLMAFDQGQIKRLSENYFYRMVPTFDSRMNLAAPEVGKLTRQYLDKVMPIDSRTYVPKWNNRPDIQVAVRQKKSGNSRNSQMKKYYSQKEMVFLMLLQKLGMRMDTSGEKWHFFAQNSLRTFVSFVLMLRHMEDLASSPEADGTRIRTIQHNYSVMESEILRRMKEERLSDGITGTRQGSANMGEDSYVKADISYKKLFEQLVNTQKALPRAFRNLYSYVLREGGSIKNPVAYELNHIARALGYSEGIRKADEILNVHASSSLSPLSSLATALEYYGYSYGEVIRIFFCYGRLNDDAKQLIHCLMAYYSLTMTRSFREFIYYRDYLKSYTALRPSDAESIAGLGRLMREKKESLISTLNGSISGSWTAKMMPSVKKSDNDQQESGNCLRKNVDMGVVFSFYIPKELKTITEQEVLEKYIRSILVFGMFFDCPSYRQQPSFRWNMEWESLPAMEEVAAIKQNSISDVPEGYYPLLPTLLEETPARISNKGGHAYFSFMNFVTNAFAYEGKTFELLEQVCAFLRDNVVDEDARPILDAIQKKIEEEFKTWAAYSGGFAIPAYDVDLCYNLMKRLRQRAYSFPVEPVDVTEFLDKYLIGADEEGTLGAYWFIARKLRENDRFFDDNPYPDSGSKSIKLTRFSENITSMPNYISFEDAFRNCPYMKWIMSPDKEDLIDNFDEQFKVMWEKMVEPGNSESLDDEVLPREGYDD